MYGFNLCYCPINKALISYRIIKLCCSCIGFVVINNLNQHFSLYVESYSMFTLTLLVRLSYVSSYFMLVDSGSSIEELGVLSVILDSDYAHCTGHMIRS